MCVCYTAHILIGFVLCGQKMAIQLTHVFIYIAWQGASHILVPPLYSCAHILWFLGTPCKQIIIFIIPVPKCSMLYCHLVIPRQTTMMSFSQGNYSVTENEGILTVSVKRYVGSDAHVVLIATHPSKGTAKGEGILCICTLLTVLCIIVILMYGLFFLATL